MKIRIVSSKGKSKKLNLKKSKDAKKVKELIRAITCQNSICKTILDIEEIKFYNDEIELDLAEVLLNIENS